MTLISFRQAREASARLEVLSERRHALAIWACGAVVAVALLSFYVHVLQQQQLHGRSLPQWQRTATPKPSAAPAVIPSTWLTVSAPKARSGAKLR